MQRRKRKAIIGAAVVMAGVLCVGCNTAGNLRGSGEGTEKSTSERIAETALTGEEEFAGEAASRESEQKENTLVFMNGAFFTGMEPVQNENYDDGSYLYEDKTEDGQTRIVNTAFLMKMGEEESTEQYLARIIEEREGGKEMAFSIEEETELEKRFRCPAFQVQWNDEKEGQMKKSIGIAAFSEDFTYLYYFEADEAVFMDMEEVYEDILSNLSLEEKGF